MNLITNLNDKNIINALLEEAGLNAFIFDTNFRLKFICKTDNIFNGKKLPMEITFSILSDWWFGNKDRWNHMVKKMTEDFTYVEPEEPVLAFKLAALRWSDGSIIESINISPEKTELKFCCGESITILNNNKGNCAWEIYETNFTDVNNCWSVVCEEGKIFYNIPD